MNLSMRLVLLGLGWVMVGIGVAGIFLPLLPTTPFLLVAAWLFARSSPRLERWLFDHPMFGQPLRDWREDGAISRGAKICALSLMALGFAFFWLRLQPSMLTASVIAAIMLAVGVFITSRPEPRP
ncbi:putative transmembrane protein [Sinorhizobium fredii NGR234]|uniref:Transmembrane protein n=1 Tax=Sinorhizobium fredii (strain NBRC 101917 / NGR234) TaxID=394 RepID=C3MA16_SINFN|nr:YbaN family protein [Sinorhizobium fredii]ACP24795.1 putative transmembrane protein [Sinorhizobium fredii NGR234]